MSFMSSLLTRAAAVLALSLPAGAALASPVMLELKASGFQNAGTQYPGFDGEVEVRLSWDTANKADPIASFLSIDIEIAGHQYTMAEIGIANQGATQTAIGAIVRGANVVVGDGVYNDFLLVFDRVNPAINAFAYSIQGKAGAIWWTPSTTSAAYVDINSVPEPATLALLLPALAGLALMRREARYATSARPGPRR